MDIISRQDAFTKGLTSFYTGQPCKWGHFARRYTSSGGCVECAYWKIPLKDDGYKVRAVLTFAEPLEVAVAMEVSKVLENWTPAILEAAKKMAGL